MKALRRMINGVMLERPLLKVDVATEAERGMLGIAIAQEEVAAIEGNDNDNYNDIPYVFSFYTESIDESNDDEGKALGSRTYKYELDQNHGELVNPKLLLDLPATPGPTHYGGKVVIGPDDNVYIIVDG